MTTNDSPKGPERIYIRPDDKEFSLEKYSYWKEEYVRSDLYTQSQRELAKWVLSFQPGETPGTVTDKLISLASKLEQVKREREELIYALGRAHYNMGNVAANGSLSGLCQLDIQRSIEAIGVALEYALSGKQPTTAEGEGK